MRRSFYFLLASLLTISCSADKYLIQEHQLFKLTVEPIDWYLTLPDADLTLQMQKNKTGPFGRIFHAEQCEERTEHFLFY